jgi:cobyrinic acid a,c-diamide synthase
MAEIARLLICTPKCGDGKTTITLALLSALAQRGVSPTAFISGLDDTAASLHMDALDIPYYTMNPCFPGDNSAREFLREHAKGRDIAVMDGAKGYYDGIGCGTEASCYDFAVSTGSPVVLVLSAKGVSLSVAAQIKGFATFRQLSRIAGVILNNCGARLYAMLRDPIEKETGLPVIGYFPRLLGCISSRNLAAGTPSDLNGLREKLLRLGVQAEESIDIDLLLNIAGSASIL